MSRELRRVPLDFDWPLNKPWKGYINNHYKKCPDCECGNSPAGEWLKSIVRILSCAGEDGRYSEEEQEELRRRGRTIPHPYLAHLETAPTQRIPRAEMDRINAIEDRHERNRVYFQAVARHNKLLPLTRELTQLTEGLAGRPISFLGHDACDQYVMMKKIVVAAGLDDETWGICPTCKGTGEDPATKEASEAWERTHPPEGEGYQLWETVSEGSPISPVFASKKKFIDYLCDQGYSWEAAANFVEKGWAPSMMISNGVIKQNIEVHDDGPIQKRPAIERLASDEEDA